MLKVVLGRVADIIGGAGIALAAMGGLSFVGIKFDEGDLFVGCIIGSAVFFVVGTFLDWKIACKKQPLSRS